MTKGLKLLYGAFIAALALLAAVPAVAQTVTTSPSFVAPRTVLDMGNGPQEIKMLTGNMGVFTSSSSGASGNATSSSTTVTLAVGSAAPATPPCVGCIISGTGITSGTTVSAYTPGSTSFTLSAAMSIATGTTLSWGAACPTSTQTTPVQPPATNLMALIQPGQPPSGDYPFYTQARLCAYGATGPGGQFLTFSIGAH